MNAPIDLGTARARKASKSRHHDPGLPSFEQTELANADAFVRRHGSDARWCYEWGTWLVWNGRHWEDKAGGAVKVMAKEDARELHRQAGVLLEAGAGPAAMDLTKHAIRSCQNRAIDATLSLAQSSLSVKPSDFDADPWALNCLNGTVDLRTGVLRPHRREDMIMHLVPFEYDPSAKCDRFEFFLGEVTKDRASLVYFLQRWLGYCLTGSTREHALAMLVGSGRNGKGVLMETIAHVLGTRLSIACPPALLTASNGDRHPTELRRLYGRRLVIASEVPKGVAFDEERVKRLTGGDTISARGMREDFTDFTPTHKFTLAVNDLPSVRDTSPAFWARMRVVPFDVSFIGREDRSLLESLRAESVGILAWLVRGCLDWQANGLGEPVEVRQATAVYRNGEDLVGRFVADCYRNHRARVPSADLQAAAKTWCESEGVKPLAMRAISPELIRMGWTKADKNDGKGWNPPQEGSRDA